ncbi:MULTISPECIES: helix-turn-helix domain-containing protein [Streptomyces]|uniref:helix-turn-helix domain-containing protein n=1 Tax=Streptomyces TaxID=1883 RepID=UPI00331BDDD5
MTTTAEAATQANVTIATIRTWCRRGVIAATKQAGRWIIDTASLAHRITIGAIKRRRNHMDQAPAANTMASKGDTYVGRWPNAITSRIGISCEYIPEAMQRLGMLDKDSATRYRLVRKFYSEEPAAEIAALTPERAMQIVAELKTIRAEIETAQRTHCRCCGLPLNRRGECNGCDDQ